MEVGESGVWFVLLLAGGPVVWLFLNSSLSLTYTAP